MIDQQVYVETEIIRQAQNGSQTAYGELYQRHLKAIYHYILKRVKGQADAEDLTQTVFLKAWQALRDYQPTTTPFRAWLYRIAHNAVIDHYRNQRPALLWDDLTPLADPQAAPEALVLASERQETMQRAITTLRPAYQEIIVHRFLHNKEYPEMAAELGHQVNNLRVLQHRALEALRRVLIQEATIGLVVALTLLLLGRHMVVEAAQALPGDSFYPLRTVVEETSLFLADDVTDIRLHMDFAARRLVELQKLLQQGRTAAVATTANNLALHIRTASAQLTQITQSKPHTGSALSAQFHHDLQQQSALLEKLTAAAPQTIQPALQPLLAVLREVQTNQQAPASVPTPEPTMTNQDAGQQAPPPPPTATPTRRTAATAAPSPGEAEQKSGAPTATERPSVESVPAGNHRQAGPDDNRRSPAVVPPTATVHSATPAPQITQTEATPEPGRPFPTTPDPVHHPHTLDLTERSTPDRPTDDPAQPTAATTPAATDATPAPDHPNASDQAKPSAETNKVADPPMKQPASPEAARPAAPSHPDRATNAPTSQHKPPRP